VNSSIADIEQVRMASFEPKAQKAFALRDSRDMLGKLRWELNNLFFRQRHDIAACQYHAFNCAVTAWHVTDWIWRDISSDPQLRIRLRDAMPMKSLDAFQGYARKNCPALKHCHRIANGSKHTLLKTYTLISDGDGYDYGNPIIVEGASQHPADKIFFDALFWYEAFLRDWNIFPEEPFIPLGDR
jgi:hypothetical protein